MWKTNRPFIDEVEYYATGTPAEFKRPANSMACKTSYYIIICAWTLTSSDAVMHLGVESRREFGDRVRIKAVSIDAFNIFDSGHNHNPPGKTSRGSNLQPSLKRSRSEALSPAPSTSSQSPSILSRSPTINPILSYAKGSKLPHKRVINRGSKSFPQHKSKLSKPPIQPEISHRPSQSPSKSRVPSSTITFTPTLQSSSTSFPNSTPTLPSHPTVLPTSMATLQSIPTLSPRSTPTLPSSPTLPRSLTLSPTRLNGDKGKPLFS
jgi:hypothetical protein